ncbi:ribosome biogenesis GTPase Der [Amnibacterium sp. CER49]|uniref:ribosome biogenesis GTPase Der n=1 Tax=Amnibacterium sp. CER49 TaxID=3039161 RepID=UPI002448B708|nr:ribosome biogenesis GTPase Der [Amnibacterium sp. CER49]MDH2444934.1 ribosome biogenesis GTPase Der [Amnibacterium sp. CER49]
MTDERYDGDDDLEDRLADLDDEAAERRATTLRAGLDDYELDDEDRVLLTEGDLEDAQAGPGPALPVLAIVGRPNVGKSALVNRILGRRAAVVEDTPGVTRDRVTYRAEWEGRDFTLVDTGGWEPDAAGLDAAVAAQAEIAVDLADAVLFVVDATVGATSTDERVVRMLRSSGKPVLLVANKVDDARLEPLVAELWSLGLGEPWPVSALHGRGVADLLDHSLKVLPLESAVARPEAGGPRRVALLGRPNVGKSSLLNKAAGEERVVVAELAGTTRDPVDEQIELAGRVWRFVDTAGIRRRTHLSQGADFYASLRTQAALERAEVAVVLLDVTQPISEQDVRIIDLVLESGRALVLAYNKWDLLDDERRRYLEREIEQDLAHVSWAPRVNISARTGRHLEKLVPALELALDSWDTRIPTGKFNAFLAELTAAHPHPVRGGKQPRILFGTQAATRPPTFVLFTTGFLDPGYRRFVQRRLRELYGLEGTPIVLNMRVRERRART